MAEAYIPYSGPIITRAEALANGLTRYFTGITCGRGHLSQRRTVNHVCVECDWKKRKRDDRNAAERAARARNMGVYKAITNRYLATDKAKEKRQAYYRQHAVEIKRRVKLWQAQNSDRVLATRAKNYRSKKELIAQRVREWNAANPEAARVRGRNYRARLNGAEGSHTADDILALFTAQDSKCVYCRVMLGKRYHVDHIRPLSRGGSNWPSNLQLLCGPCNVSKRATDPDEFLRRLKLKETTMAEIDPARVAATKGAQVVLDPASGAALGAKGVFPTIQENTDHRDLDLIAQGYDPMAPSGHATDDRAPVPVEPPAPLPSGE